MSKPISISLLVVPALMALGASASDGAANRIPCDSPHFGLSPYTWKMTGAGDDARAEAMMPGAYFRTIANGTAAIGVVIDGTANSDCPPASMPVIEYSVDDGPFVSAPLTQTGTVYVFALADGLAPAASHRLEFFLRAADLTQKRWTSSMAHLRIGGLALDEGGTISAYPMRPRKAIGFGDSITEGVGVDGLFTSWQSLGVNNARGSWFAFVCDALDCEYGQFGSGGQGMVKELEMPGLPKTWDHYGPDASRLTGGLLIPEPDYVFCCMGTNDFGGIDITNAYTAWLAAVRKACPHAYIFCVVPPAGVHRDEINNARHDANDSRVHVIDIPRLNTAITARAGATQLTYDGVHPSMQGEGLFAANVVAQVQRVLAAAPCPVGR